jgi:hypothetical protein
MKNYIKVISRRALVDGQLTTRAIHEVILFDTEKESEVRDALHKAWTIRDEAMVRGIRTCVSVWRLCSGLMHLAQIGEWSARISLREVA